MDYRGWLGLGFGLGFLVATYIFSAWFRDHLHAAIKGLILGSRAQSETPNLPARTRVGRIRKRKCFVCPESSPQDEMIQAQLGGQTVWIHEKCQGKLTEVKTKFDYMAS